MTFRWADLADLIRWGAGRDAGRPFLTWYDDEHGGRVELSYATFDNWVAKTAGMLRDGMGIEPGDTVTLLLPPHWQSLGTLFGAWAAGAHVVTAASVDEALARSASVLIADEPVLGEVVSRRGEAGSAQIVGASLGGLRQQLSAAPPGVLDLADELPPNPDSFTPFAPADLDAPALTAGTVTLSGRELVDAAEATLIRWELGPVDRALVVLDGRSLGDMAPFTLAVFIAGGGLVACRGMAEDDLAARCASERVTVADVPPQWTSATSGVVTGLRAAQR